MTVKQFVENYRNIKIDSLKEKAIKEIMVDKHLSFVEKTNIAEKTAKASCTNPNTKKFQINSISNFYFSTIALLQNFTSLEGFNGDGKEMLDNYELLDECGALNVILGYINEKEKGDLMTCIRMATDDYIANQTNVFTQIENAINSFGEMLTTAYAGMSPEDKDKIVDMVASRVNNK